jgi:hypothetical protein
MDTNQATQGLGDSQSTNQTALDSNTRLLDPHSFLGTSLPHSQRGRFDQMALNYSGSKAVAPSSDDSHYQYPKQDGHAAQGQRNDTMDSVTESSITTDASYYSYRSARDLSAFVKEVDGRFVSRIMPSLYLPLYLECLIISPTFTCCQVVNISPRNR